MTLSRPGLFLQVDQLGGSTLKGATPMSVVHEDKGSLPVLLSYPFWDPGAGLDQEGGVWPRWCGPSCEIGLSAT